MAVSWVRDAKSATALKSRCSGQSLSSNRIKGCHGNGSCLHLHPCRSSVPDESPHEVAKVPTLWDHGP